MPACHDGQHCRCTFNLSLRHRRSFREKVFFKTLPLPCASTAFAAKTLPLPCVFTLFAAKKLSLGVPTPLGGAKMTILTIMTIWCNSPP